MVSKAIDEGLLTRIQNYVARDINSKIPLEGSDAVYRIKAEDIFINNFNRILNNWQAVASARGNDAGYYVLVHDGDFEMTRVYIFTLLGAPQQAII